ncbi:thioesterase [Sediminibacterium roseum]|uniref:Thioesterase n=1 Tax=Sediminibacterium roseum TaxID=1978412 RepID=A0ABX0A024_9BACT|nr:thioesterase family protein [Sediminibacterium roseum]NCI50585.1 thioesterase [Sediminibacterium roseum]
MHSYFKKVEIRWSDIDANFHLRHSVYYDFGAFVRISFLAEHGLTTAHMQQQHIGPILFREECVFKREIHFSDTVTIYLKLVTATADMGRWTMVHEIYKNEDTLAAVLTIDGAWMDTEKRKLVAPPDFFREVFEKLPK